MAARRQKYKWKHRNKVTNFSYDFIFKFVALHAERWSVSVAGGRQQPAAAFFVAAADLVSIAPFPIGSWSRIVSVVFARRHRHRIHRLLCEKQKLQKKINWNYREKKLKIKKKQQRTCIVICSSLASFWIWSIVFGFKSCRRGCHLEFLKSITSWIMKRMRLFTLMFLRSAISFIVLNIGFKSLFFCSSSFPIVVNSLHRHSKLSSSRVSSNLLRHRIIIFTVNICCLNNSPIETKENR